jgi:protein phosphatase PTC2/3
MDQKSKLYGGNQRGRIILLGDGTEVLTDSDDTEMFDNGEEDKDLASQVSKGDSKSEDKPAVVPDKLNVSDPKIKAASDGILSNSTPTEKSEK